MIKGKKDSKFGNFKKRKRVIEENDFIDDDDDSSLSKKSIINLSLESLLEKSNGMIEEEQNLTKKEITILNKIKSTISNETPTLSKIFASRLSHQDMVIVYQLYNLMIRCEKDSLDYISYCKKINFVIKGDNINIDKIKNLKILKSDKQKITCLYEKLIYQCIYGDDEWYLIISEIKKLSSQSIESDDILLEFDSEINDCKNIKKEIMCLHTETQNKIRILSLLNNDDDLKRVSLYSKLPFNKININKFNIEKAYELLNKELYGMDKVKSKIIAILNDRNYNSDEPCILALKGNPGTGKTSIAMAIAKILELPFGKISMAGAEDSSIITGSSPLWTGASQSLILNELIKHNTCNPVILIDEVDKISSSDRGIALENSLLHLLDTTQNFHFNDLYLHEIPHDLSKIFFILTMNSETNISPILKDRLTIIDIPSYTKSEVIEITINHIIPKILRKRNLEGKIIFEKLSCNTIYTLSSNNDGTSGIRSIEKTISDIVSKISLMEKNIYFSLGGKKVSEQHSNIKFNGWPYTVTSNMIQHFIEKQHIQHLSYYS